MLYRKIGSYNEINLNEYDKVFIIKKSKLSRLFFRFKLESFKNSLFHC